MGAGTGGDLPLPDHSASAGQPVSPGTVEVVTIGDELILGLTLDRNAAWLARRLAEHGIRVIRCTSVGDDEDSIARAVDDALRRTGTVLCTGGLGPTSDDRTRPAVARLFGRALTLDAGVLNHIRRRFEERGLPPPESSLQAQVPEGAALLTNPAGTAPAIVLEDGQRRVAILLPGVPAEVRSLVEVEVLPWLLRRWPRLPHPVRHRLLRTTGITESALAARIEPHLSDIAPLSVAFLPRVTGVDLRLTSWGALRDSEVEPAFHEAERRLAPLLQGHLYGRDDETIADAVAHALIRDGLQLAVAESCTAGMIAAQLTDRPGASAFLRGGIVAYADAAKSALLGVHPDILREHGAVSEATAAAMASGARAALAADVAVSVTGIAGPTGGTPEKPVGTVCIATDLAGDVLTRRYRFGGNRDEIRGRAAQAALTLLWRRLG